MESEKRERKKRGEEAIANRERWSFTRSTDESQVMLNLVKVKKTKRARGSEKKLVDLVESSSQMMTWSPKPR